MKYIHTYKVRSDEQYLHYIKEVEEKNCLDIEQDIQKGDDVKYVVEILYCECYASMFTATSQYCGICGLSEEPENIHNRVGANAGY